MRLDRSAIAGIGWICAVRIVEYDAVLERICRRVPDRAGAHEQPTDDNGDT
ncbi:MAG TPA: hypothetical protein VGD80_34105 [Kofleriaceae bacterium]